MDAGRVAPFEPARSNTGEADTSDATVVDGFKPVTAGPGVPGQAEASDDPSETPKTPQKPSTGKHSAPGKHSAGDRRQSQVATPVNRVHAPLTRSDLIRLPAGDGNIVLPVPPSDKEKYSFIRRRMWVLTLSQLITFPPLVYSQFRMFQDSPWFLVYAPFVVMGVITFLISLIADGIGKGFSLAEHKKIVASWFPLWYPSVDVFLPVCGEPIELLRNTWTHVAALRSNYNGKLTPYVLDDGANPAAKALARELGFAYATRPNRGWYKKSGNIKYGYDISDGEFILLLDADFAPRPDLLEEALPYFARFPDVGIVQTPQFFHVDDRQTWVERGGGAIQELFYRAIQTTRSNKAGAICVGSCAVYRRSALDDNDGMSLAEHSEDLHTGFDLDQLGWKLKYLPITLSTGNCPDNILSFLNQQYRWCSGTFSLLQGDKFWKAKMSWYTRLCYLAGVAGYVYTAVFTFIGPLLGIGMLVLVPSYLRFGTIVLIAPVLFYAGVIYPMWHHCPYRLEAWSVRLLSGWAHVFAIWDLMRGRLRGWQPSGTGAKKQDGRHRLWIGLIGWSFGTAVLWAALALYRMMTMNPYDFYLTFALGVFQMAVVGRILVQPRESS